jgi:hypothetical protein
MKVQTRRDLTIISGIGDKCLVIACDSCGAIGEKEADVLKLPAQYVSKFTTRVALSEVMCSGAIPATIINGAACEMKPTGEQLIFGIQEELRNANIADIVLTGSTEENFEVNVTAIAITVIGIAAKDELKFGKAAKEDKLILIGSPEAGAEVCLESVGFYGEIRQLLSLTGVREIVPVGSKGIAYEAKTLASINNMELRFSDAKKTVPIDLQKSAGPATCLIVLCSESSVAQVLEIYPKGVIIGELR